MRYLIAVVVMAVVAGCSFGRAFSQKDLDQFKVGVTTRSDAELVLGEPNYAVQKDGKTGLAWIYGESGPYGINSGGKSVTLMFGPDGKLADPPAASFSGKFIPSAQSAQVTP